MTDLHERTLLGLARPAASSTEAGLVSLHQAWVPLVSEIRLHLAADAIALGRCSPVSRAGAAWRRPGRPGALILAPTRELATQIHAAMAPLAAALSLRTMTVFGGVGAEQTPRMMPTR